MSLNEDAPKGLTDRGAAIPLPFHPEPSAKQPGTIQRSAKAILEIYPGNGDIALDYVKDSSREKEKKSRDKAKGIIQEQAAAASVLRGPQ